MWASGNPASGNPASGMNLLRNRTRTLTRGSGALQGCVQGWRGGPLAPEESPPALLLDLCAWTVGVSACTPPPGVQRGCGHCTGFCGPRLGGEGGPAALGGPPGQP